MTYHKKRVVLSDRIKLSGTRPSVIWLTGRCYSYNREIAVILEKMFIERGFSAYLLDSDTIGSFFKDDPADQIGKIRRIAEMARIIADSGQTAIVSVPYPLCGMGEEARRIISERADFIGVFVDAYDSDGADTADSCEIRITSLSDYDGARKILEYMLERQIDYSHVIEVMKKAARKAGEKITEIYRREFTYENKSDNSPLTEADLASDAVITEMLSSEFPYISILTEESADDRSRLFNRWCFIVDPLDGTREFIRRNGEFTVNIALACNHESVAGVIYIPVIGELYWAVRGKGAFREAMGKTEMIKASDRREGLIVVNSRAYGGDARLRELLDKNSDRIGEVISVGSSIKGCRVAEGKADIYYRFGPTMEWDTAAMQIICEEAGAYFRQLDGYDSPMYYNRTHTRNDMGFYIVNIEENKL